MAGPRYRTGNPFAAAWVAPRYAAGRPDIHPAVAASVRSILGPEILVRTALDVACGTGLSSRAFTEISDVVLGVDVAESMVRAATPHPRVRYLIASAEELPFVDEWFDLATIGCAFHWCQTERLFAEAARVLNPGGTFVIYDNWFDGEMRGSVGAKEWLASIYRPRYPLPPRGPIFEPDMTPTMLFEHVRTDFVEQWIPLTREQLAGYLTTQSSAVHAVESGSASVEDVEAFARNGLESVFGGREVGEFKFRGPLSILRRC